MKGLGYLDLTDGESRKILRDSYKRDLREKRAEYKEYRIRKKFELDVQKEAAKNDIKLYKRMKEQEFKQKADQNKILTKLKKKYGFIKSPKGKRIEFMRGVNRSAKAIGQSNLIKQVARNQRLQAAYDMRMRVNRPVERERPGKLRNFFAHGSEMEVYGDEGLTFFDSEKRAADDTGALFGFK